MSYAIFRSASINKLSDLSQIGSHNKREKKAYQSNPDIDITRTRNNIEIVPLVDKYTKGFYNLTKEYKKEHDKRMLTMREDRKKTFKQMIDSSNNVVADELLFTSDSDFFKNMNDEEIEHWANTCMEFVYEDLGYSKEQILHATVHMDEKTPHMHCVVVPLVKKFDKRTNTERLTISKKQYIKDKAHLSELQDKYYERLIDNGFNLERGIKNSDNEHISIKEFKKITNKLDNQLKNQNNLMTKTYEKLEEKLINSKPTITGKEVKIDKDTYETLNKFMDTSKKVIIESSNNKALFKELEEYTNSYRDLENENRNIKYEVNRLKYENLNLKYENSKLHKLITTLLDRFKHFFHEILKFGSEINKYEVIDTITDLYEQKLYKQTDLYDITDNTSKKEHINVYLKCEKEKNKNDMYI